MYNRDAAVAYAHRWAFGRNPRFLNFTPGLGGDCTNFVSQCLSAGGAHMNYTKTFGWYYSSAYDRAPAWSAVQFLYNFLLSNGKTGPFARAVDVSLVRPGDVVQLSFAPDTFGHSLLVVATGETPAPENILVAAHSDDSDDRPLTSYNCLMRRYLSIDAR